MILATIGQIITQGHGEYEAKYARRKSQEETAATTPAAEPSVVPAEATPAPAVASAPAA